jgi:hypothetical protein
MPSMQFCIENLDQAGGCTYNYSCAYTDTISWASPNEPLPMIRDPRVAFDMLFGSGNHGGRPRGAARHAAHDSRLTSPVKSSASVDSSDRRPHAAGSLSRQRARVERRIQAVEAHNRSGEQRDCPRRRPGCPIRSPST